MRICRYAEFDELSEHSKGRFWVHPLYLKKGKTSFSQAWFWALVLQLSSQLFISMDIFQLLNINERWTLTFLPSNKGEETGLPFRERFPRCLSGIQYHFFKLYLHIRDVSPCLCLTFNLCELGLSQPSMPVISVYVTHTFSHDCHLRLYIFPNFCLDNNVYIMLFE